MKWIYNDGGRTSAGYKGTTRDCVTRSIAIATGMPYQNVYDVINALASDERTGSSRPRRSSARTGVRKPTYRRYLASIGWNFTPTMQIGQGCKVHLRENELPKGTLMVSVSKHLTSVIDGVIHDTFDPSRDGTRCVYGYYTKDNVA